MRPLSLEKKGIILYAAYRTRASIDSSASHYISEYLSLSLVFPGHEGSSSGFTF